MKQKILVLSVGLFLFLSRSEAIDIAAVAAMNLSNAGIEQPIGTSVATSSASGMGFGVQMGLPLLPGFQIQPGAIYLNHRYSVGTTERSLTGIHIPILLRFNALPLISFGAGPYFTFLNGDVADRNTSLPGTPATTTTLSALGYSSSDFGMVLTAGAEFELAPITYLLVELRYFAGIKDLDDNPLNTLKLKGILLMAGLKLGL